MKKILINSFLSLIFLNHSIAQIQIGQELTGDALWRDFGQSLALSSEGKRMIVGVPGNNNVGFYVGVGGVRVFDDIGGVWQQIGNDIEGENGADYLGSSVAISDDGTRIAVGIPGYNVTGQDQGIVRIYEENGPLWTQIGNDIAGITGLNMFGTSISISNDGSRIAIGAPGHEFQIGYAEVYSENGGVWSLIDSTILGEFTGDKFGCSVAFNADGTRLAVGAKYNNGSFGSDSGSTKVFEEVMGAWTQIGSEIDGETSNDRSGSAISLSSDGKVLAVGAPYNDANGNANCGHVRVYRESGGIWAQIGNDIDGESAFDESGSAISLSSDGKILAIGAKKSNQPQDDSGHIRIFRDSLGHWIPLGNDINGQEQWDWFGLSVSISRNGYRLAGGARGTIFGSNPPYGIARVYSMPCYANYSIDIQDACDTYTWIDGNTYTESSDSTTFILTNSAGCDSTITLDLTINSYPDSTVTESGGLLIANQADASYQWLDCDNDLLPISGETNQTFSPNTSGNYAVQVTMADDCGSTSSCNSIVINDIEEALNIGHYISPNPTSDHLNISFAEMQNEITITLHDISGKLIYEDFLRNKSNTRLNIEGESGIYILEIKTSSGINQRHKIIVSK